jgi:hypothetical protein
MKNAKDISLAARKERAAIEGRNALAEYESQGAAARKNMARLRELRLAKEAADSEAEAARIAAEPPPAPKKKKKKAVVPAAT